MVVGTIIKRKKFRTRRTKNTTTRRMKTQGQTQEQED
jgi:hypothetical protein